MNLSGASRRRIAVLPLTAAGILLTGGSPARAQEEFRAADLDRPLRVEDAYPADFREWELEAGLRSGFGATDELSATLELKSGLFLNGQVGIELHGGLASGDEGDAAGLENAALHLLYSLRRETWGWPAFSGRFDLETPGSGELGREGWALSVKGLATRSFGRLRMHANLGYTAADEADEADFWRGGLAIDYPIGLFSRSVLGDVYAEIPGDGGDTRAWTTVGTRWQLTNRTVLDLGVGTRLDEWVDGDGNVELVMGISRGFGVPVLVDVPPYPDPRID